MHPAILVWLSLALAYVGKLLNLNVPIRVLFSEAVQVANFFARYFANTIDAESGKVTAYGLESVGEKLPAKTGKDILSLREAAYAADHAYFTILERRSTATKVARASFIYQKLARTLEWYLEDSPDGLERLSLILKAHRKVLGKASGLARALGVLGELAKPHRAGISGLGGFDAALLDEIPLLSAELFEKADSARLSPEVKRALELRNRMLQLLADKIQLVRRSARFVFAGRQDVLREVTSEYARRRDAALRKKKKAGLYVSRKRKSPPKPPPPKVEPPMI